MDSKQLGTVLRKLEDGALLEGLRRAVAVERKGTALVVAHLAEVDTRRLYRDEGCRSLLVYCVERLGLSEGQAYKRIFVARLVPGFPQLLQALADGRIHLAGAVLLGPKLTPESADELIAAAEGKSKSMIEQMLAARFPSPDVPELIRKLPMRVASAPAAARAEDPAGPCPEHPAVAGQLALDDRQPATAAAAATTLSIGAAPIRQSSPLAPPRLTPLSAERYKLQVTVDGELKRKLDQVRDLLRHQLPNGDLNAILSRALELLIDQQLKARFAKTTRPRRQPVAQPKNPKSRHIPAAVRREVFERDGQRCTFTSPDGRRCTATGRLELDHIHPHAAGGRNTSKNLRLLCQAHNQLLAERHFGNSFMAFKRSPNSPRGQLSAPSLSP